MFPRGRALPPHHGLADAITPDQIFAAVTAAELLRGDGVAAGTGRSFAAIVGRKRLPVGFLLHRQWVLQPHGQSFRIRTPSVSICAALPSPTAGIACRDPRRRNCGRCMFGGHAIWREISGRRPVGRRHACGRRMAGIHFPHVLDRGRQLPVADRELDRELHICGSDRGLAPRHLPSPDRARAELFFRPLAGHADQPHYRDLERGVHGRKHVRLECAAAMHGDDFSDRPDRNGEPVDGGGPDRRSPVRW